MSNTRRHIDLDAKLKAYGWPMQVARPAANESIHSLPYNFSRLILHIPSQPIWHVRILFSRHIMQLWQRFLWGHDLAESTWGQQAAQNPSSHTKPSQLEIAELANAMHLLGKWATWLGGLACQVLYLFTRYGKHVRVGLLDQASI